MILRSDTLRDRSDSVQDSQSPPVATSERGTLRIYCAGPLFNSAERAEMTSIAEALVDEGYHVYLPHRDGMEFRLVLEKLLNRRWSAPVAARFLHAAIFALDVYQAAIECHAMVWNLNGRTPDEGAVSEAAIAWTLGKPLVAYSDDVRSLIAGRINPLLAGLVDFETVGTLAEIPAALETALRDNYYPDPTPETLPPKLARTVEDGRILWEAMTRDGAQYNNDLIAEVVARLFAPPDGPVSLG